MKTKIKMSRHELQVRADFQPSSIDAKKRTIDLVWSTGSRVKRYDWNLDTYYWEELSMNPEHIRMERLRGGAAPFLNNHSNWDLRDVIGVVERAEVKDNVGTATVRFSKRDDVEPIFQDVSDGILRNISVGYKVLKIEKTNERFEDLPVYRVIDWEPLEISLVGIPADAKSQVRAETDFIECEIINPEENDMGKRSQTTPVKKPDVHARSETTPSDASAPAAQAEETDAVEETPSEEVAETEVPATEAPTTEVPASEAERAAHAEEVRAEEIKRSSTIRTAVRLAGLSEEVGDELANNPAMTADAARTEIFARLEKKQPTTNNQRFEVKDMDAKKVRKEQTTRAILHRFDSERFAMEQGDTEIGRGSMTDMARNFLHAEGVRDAYTMSKSEVAKRALHSSSDFPEVLANVANKSLQAGYAGAPNTYEPFCESKNVSDFKDITSVQLSNGGTLQPVNEDGEYERTTLKEAADKYKVEKFGLIIGKTWELMVNDDLGAFTKIPQKLGQRAKEKENEIFWNMILANPIMGETGLSLFNDGHNNRSNNAAISIAEIGIAREKMRLHKDLDGELLSAIAPSYLVVPAALETLAEQFISQITPNENGKVNPFASKLKVLAEGRLDASSRTAWYIFSDKMKAVMAEIARLDGKGPEMFVKEGFDVDGMELKIRYVFGMKLLDYRGFFRNKT